MDLSFLWSIPEYAQAALPQMLSCQYPVPRSKNLMEFHIPGGINSNLRISMAALSGGKHKKGRHFCQPLYFFSD